MDTEELEDPEGIDLGIEVFRKIFGTHSDAEEIVVNFAVGTKVVAAVAVYAALIAPFVGILGEDCGKGRELISIGLNLFGHKVEPSAIDLSVFCDERKIPPNNTCLAHEEWIYICMIFIPDRNLKEALQKLQNVRDRHSYQHEIAFRKIEKPSCKSQITAVAKDWITLLLSETSIFYWNILGIAKHNLNFICFGPSDDATGKYADIYNRFFRTAFLGTVNSFFKDYEMVNISQIFHDCEGNLENHDYFRWHLAWKASGNRILFSRNDIIFAVSNHEKEPAHPGASQITQLSDVLIGAVSQCLDNLSTKPGKVEVAEIVCPVLDLMMNRPYARELLPRACSISFFPSKRLSNEEVIDALSRVTSTFFQKRRILMRERGSGQMALPGFE